MEESKQEHCLNLKDIQECLHQKEVLENATKFNEDFKEEEFIGAARDPL